MQKSSELHNDQQCWELWCLHTANLIEAFDTYEQVVESTALYLTQYGGAAVPRILELAAVFRAVNVEFGGRSGSKKVMYGDQLLRDALTYG